MNDNMKKPRKRILQPGQKIISFLLCWLIFTFLLGMDLLIVQQPVEIGEPSESLILAPYDMTIRNMELYEQQLEELSQNLQPLYRVDESFVQTLVIKMDKMFSDLNYLLYVLPEPPTTRGVIGSDEEAGATGEAESEVTGESESESEAEDETEIALIPEDETEPLTPEEEKTALRNSDYFGALSDDEFSDLLETSESVIESVAKEALAITQLLQNLDQGAKTEAELPLLLGKIHVTIEGLAIPAAFKQLLRNFIDYELVRPNLVIDLQATEWALEEARDSVEPEVYNYRANEKIVGLGEIIDEKIYYVLSAYGLAQEEPLLHPLLGIALLVLLCLIFTVVFAYQFCPQIIEHWQKIFIPVLTGLIVIIVCKGIFGLDLGSDSLNLLLYFLAPIAVTTMMVSILLGIRMAVLIAIVQSVFVCILASPTGMAGFSGEGLVICLISGLVGAQSTARLGYRSDLAKTGLYITLVNLALLAVRLLMADTVWLEVPTALVLIGSNAVFSVVFTVGALPAFEYGFKITSSVRLIELSNPNHPLLKALLMEAPGTYHHSVMVGNLAETAAEAIGADPVLVRVGALYHDIGKLKRPYFFIENQFGRENPHNRIAPTLSALILTAHTKDGLEMAKEHKLPEAIQQIVVQHHGDSIAQFFYVKAKEEMPDVSEDLFRYSGPNPQTKEAALVLLADSVEAAVRAGGDGNPGKIEGTVRRIIKDKLDKGHLALCDLTFRDLDKIAVAFVKVLTGMYHSRIEYPDMQLRKALKAPPKPAEETTPAPAAEAKAAPAAEAETAPTAEAGETPATPAAEAGEVTSAPMAEAGETPAAPATEAGEVTSPAARSRKVGG